MHLTDTFTTKIRENITTEHLLKMIHDLGHATPYVVGDTLHYYSKTPRT